MKSVKQMVKEYFAPVMVVVAFLAIFFEMVRQMVIMTVMDSESFDQLQEQKLIDEHAEMSASPNTAEVAQLMEKEQE